MDAMKLLKSAETLHNKILSLYEKYAELNLTAYEKLNEPQMASFKKLETDLDNVLHRVQIDLNLLGVMASAKLDANSYQLNEARTLINSVDMKMQAFEKLISSEETREPDDN